MSGSGTGRRARRGAKSPLPAELRGTITAAASDNDRSLPRRSAREARRHARYAA